MTLFAGVVSLDGVPAERSDEERINAAIGGSTGAERRRLGAAVFFQRASGREERPEQRLCVRQDGRALYAALARLDNRDEIAALLGFSPPEAAGIVDADLLCEMFERRGAAGVARCLGAFAFAYWENESRRLTLCRDYLGRRAIQVYRNGHRIAFATSLARLLAMPRVPRELDPLQVANCLARDILEPRQTVYRGIERVPSRTIVTISPAGIDHRHYWSPDLSAPPPFKRDEDYIERARELLELAVATATAGQSHVAISTSGGLDSSAVAATVARLGRTRRITCYTQLPPDDWDVALGPGLYRSERDKVLALGRMYPQIELRLLPEDACHPHAGDDWRHFSRRGLPSQGPSNVDWYLPRYDAVRADGHHQLHTGRSGNHGLSWRGPSSLLVLLRTGQLSALVGELVATGHETRNGVCATLVGDLLRPAAPRSVRRLIRALRGRDRIFIRPYSALNPAFIADAGLDRIWREQGRDDWSAVDAWHPQRRRAAAIFDYCQWARDNTAETREISGYEIRDPLGDRRLIEFLLAVPEPLYRRNGVPRSFARAVLADRLPPEILRERRYGDQGGAWFRRLDRQRATIAADLERFEASSLCRQLLDLPRLKRLLDEWPADEHAAQTRQNEFCYALRHAVHVGRFVRWVEGANA
ncbi:MAG TPA: asparagine synthase-related protein [Xanthobacteraceae bacterium]|nr:asparagine synthase-related protein [Xanthobacteraceae bacterium]